MQTQWTIILAKNHRSDKEILHVQLRHYSGATQTAANSPGSKERAFNQ
jgi:hypothetical protein